jgi:hypothetical protein
MSRRRSDDLYRALYRSWREAEGRADESGADAAFAALFGGLPLEAPPAGFAARVLAAARVRDRRSESLSRAAAARLAAALLALMSLGTFALASLVVSSLPRLDFGVAVRAFTRGLGLTWEWIASGLAFWDRLAEWSALVARVVGVPAVAASLLASALAAAAAFVLLRRLLAEQGNLTYAEPH